MKTSYAELPVDYLDFTDKELLCAYRQLDPIWQQCAIKQIKVLAQEESRQKKPADRRIIEPHPAAWGRTAGV
jgi:hypothetical protein